MANYLRLLNERVRIEKEVTKSLVTDISHQLKTPVAALKTSFEILQQDNLSISEKKEFADRCSLQIQGIENLLEALINISRMETGMIEIKLENQCIFDTVLQGVNRVLQKADEKGIQIEMEAEEELQEMEVPHDRKWLCEAFINILENAVKYSPSETCISIRMMRRVSFMRIEIADQGIGIPISEYNQVFKRFYRGISREVKVQAGSGVGLYLTREIISRHNGTVSVSAGEKGIGSVFTIQLPYH
ncbi:MAG TPA: HAMP domain-containing sensor histidine kinase [Lachnospiraceae bacterium]|nr:HAMP domain-containing sensor histidine kinase [Lachnospiraceae bacterium]